MTLFFVVVFRWVLQKLVGLTATLSIATCLITLILMSFLALAPSFLPWGMEWWDPFSKAESIAIITLAEISASNWLEGGCAVLLVAIMLLLLLHRLAWPLIKRPLYAANRKGLIRNTKLLGALGTLLLLYAFPENAIVKWAIHFLPNLKGG